MFHRLSLKTILIGGAILAAVIPAALVEIALIGSLRGSGIHAATERDELLAKGLASEYGQFLRSHRQAVITLAEHAEESSAIDAASLAPLLARTRNGYSALGAMAIVGPSGRIVVSDPAMTEDGRSTVGIDVSDRAWFGEILRTRQPLIDPDVVRGRVRQNLMVTISAPILDRAGGLRGVVIMDSVERATTATPAPIVEEPPPTEAEEAATAGDGDAPGTGAAPPGVMDPWTRLLQNGLELLGRIAATAGSPGLPGPATAPLPFERERDERTGRMYLKIRMPEPEVVDRVADALQALLTSLRA